MSKCEADDLLTKRLIPNLVGRLDNGETRNMINSKTTFSWAITVLRATLKAFFRSLKLMSTGARTTLYNLRCLLESKNVHEIRFEDGAERGRRRNHVVREFGKTCSLC